jgi:photosystem II stability/assembly factor-like uncharacterized protein
LIPDDPELRAALEARSGAPSPDFAGRLGASLRTRRPAPNLMPAIAAVVVLALCAATIGVLVYTRHLQPRQGGVASGPRLSTPTPTESPIVLPTFLELDASPKGVVWVILQDERLYRSTDRGDSWERRQLPPAGGGGPWSISFVDGSNGWALRPGVPATQCQSAGAQVWRTSDGAKTWKKVAEAFADHESANGLGSRQCKDSISFVDLQHGFVTAWDDNFRPTIYMSGDGGATWKASTLPDPPGFKTIAGGDALHAQKVRRLGSTYLVSAYGMQPSGGKSYVFRSIDGAHWNYAADLPDAYMEVVYLTDSKWLQILLPGQSMETTNAGRTWHPFASDYTQAAGVPPQIVFGDASAGYATVRGSIQRTLDGGLHWSYIKTPGVVQPG